ncbi:MAG: tetratricopeptide repeat protein, partial [Bryobacteraceae bacterium]
FGLNQGFDYYDSPFQAPTDREADSADLKRLGQDVIRSATTWIDRNASRQFFVFLHLFDLHTPDNLPASIRKRFFGPRYQAELAYVDEVLGGFFQYLVKKGLYEKALIVFTSDHGEGLGDHAENSHGFFIYQSTLAVPLIVRWPKDALGYVSHVDEPVSLMGIAPTILAVTGAPQPASFKGKSLLALARGRKSPSSEEIYAESYYGRSHFNTSSLWSLRKGRHKYIHAPKPEFYDLQTDPGERTNLWTARRSEAQAYQKRLTDLRSTRRTGPGTAKPNPEVVARLRSLGYLAGSSKSQPPRDTGADPKDRIADYEAYRRAVTLSSVNRLTEANRLLTTILSKDPALLDVHMLLGLNFHKLNKHEQAVSAFRQILKTAPANVPAHFYLANSYLELKKQTEAITELEAALAAASGPGREWQQITVPSEELLARLLLERKEYDRARAHYDNLLSVDSSNYEAHYNLAWLAAREQRLPDGVRHLQAAIRARPADAAARNALGGLYLRLGRLPEAEKELQEAVRLDGNSPWALYNLGLVLRRRGDRENAAVQFKRALQVEPGFRPAQQALDQLRPAAP